MRLVSVVFALGVFVSVADASVPVVLDGQAKAVVVLPAQPSPVARYAADELVYHVEKATGVKLLVVAEGQAPSEPAARLYLGPTEAAAKAGMDPAQLSPDTFVLRTVGDSLYVVGRDSDGDPLSPDTWAGTLFGVYELLEEAMGVRWLWPGDLGEYVPAAKTITISDLDKTAPPQLIIRRLRSTLDNRRLAANPEDTFSPQALAKAKADQDKWLRRQRMGHSRKMKWGHSFTGWWEKYGKEHPDWFNLLDNGKRGPQSGNRGDRTGMCVSNPGFHQQIVENWLKACAESPDNKPNINGCENDVYGRCQCENCKAWDVPRPDAQSYAKRFSEYGIVSDRYARFWRTVQEMAAQHDPDVIVTGYAYVNYAPPPVREKLNDHVWIGLVPDSFFPRSAEEQKQCIAMWEGWAKTGCKLFLRPNYTLNGYCMPYIYTHQFAEEFAHDARNGMIATDFDSLTAMWATQGPQTYLFARWQSCLDKPVDDVLAEYFAGFGPAAGKVKAYFDYWEDYTTTNRERFHDAAKRLGGSWAAFCRMAHECFTPEAFAKGRKLLDEAQAAAAGDPTFAARVDFLQKGLTHAEKCAAACRAHASGDFLAIQEAMNDLRRYRRQIEKDNVANLAFCAWIEQRSFGGAKRSVTYSGEPLAPVAAEVQPAEPKPILLRGDFGIVALLKAGESFQATIQASRVGKNEAAITWSLLNPAKQPIAKGAVELGKSDRINVPAPAAGVYNLLLSTARNAAHLTLDNKHAVILGRDVALIHESGPLWFYVPPQTKGFKLNLESPAPGETARIAVCDPDGREVASAETGAKDKVSVSVSVSAGQDGKSWSVVPSRAPMGIMEDYTIALGDELPPYWAQAPDRLLVPAKWGRR